MEGYEIVGQILVEFRGLPTRLVRLFGKSQEWWRSHGRIPKTVDPNGSGNMSPVDHYLKYVDQIGACSPKAGLKLNNSVHAELTCRLLDSDEECTQKELRHNILKEATGVMHALDERDFSDATKSELMRWDGALNDLVEIAQVGQRMVRNNLSEEKPHG